MQYLKFKIFMFPLAISLFCSNSFGFTDADCITSNFTSKIAHKGAPFGLTQNILKIAKNNCSVSIEHEKLKFLTKKWDIDVCRGPVHIKAGAGEVEILKREENCSTSKKSSEYCKAMSEIFLIVQDDGLIFAPGEKEDIHADHGKVFCSFLLIKKYLEEGVVFSRQNQYENFLIPANPVAPSPQPTINPNQVVTNPIEEKK